MNEDYSALSADTLTTTAWSIPTGFYEYTNNTYNWTTTNMLTTISDGNIATKETDNTPDELKINIKKSKVKLDFEL